MHRLQHQCNVTVFNSKRQKDDRTQADISERTGTPTGTITEHKQYN